MVDATTFEKMEVSQTVKRKLSYDPIIKYIPKRKNVYSHKNLHTNMYSNLIHYSREVEITQLSVIHHDNGILFRHKKWMKYWDMLQYG